MGCTDEEALCRLRIRHQGRRGADTALFVRNANKLHELGRLSEERLQMIDSILCDRSVILQSMCKTAPECITPTVIYDCQSEEDFNELEEQEIE